MNDKTLVEALARELHDKFLTAEDYENVMGENKPTWEEEAEFNKDDFRLQARIAIEFLQKVWN